MLKNQKIFKNKNHKIYITKIIIKIKIIIIILEMIYFKEWKIINNIFLKNKNLIIIIIKNILIIKWKITGIIIKNKFKIIN